MIETQDFPGGFYCDYLPSGEYVVLCPLEKSVLGSESDLPPVPNDDFPLFLSITNKNGFRAAGKGHRDGSTTTWEYIADDDKWYPHEEAVGNFSVIYDNNGTLHISRGGSVGSQGWRYVAPDNTLVRGDDTYASNFGLYEWTDLSPNQDRSLVVGQGQDGGVVIKDGTTLRLLRAGACYAIKAHREGEKVSLAFYSVKPDGLTAHLVLATIADLRALPPIAIFTPPVHVEPIAAINRPLWLGFFMFANGPAAPGNCSLAVRNVSGRQARPVIVSDETLRSVGGEVLGYWCAAPPGGVVADVEMAAERAAHVGVRPVAYWDARYWPHRPALSVGSWCCVQAYRKVGETVEAFEQSLRDAVSVTARYGYDVAIVAQCYTDNASLTKDLASVVAVVARVTKDIPRVVAVLPFSGAGRATGLQDHADIRPLWEQVAATITTPVLNPPPPAPRPTPPSFFPKAKVSKHMKIFAKLRGKYIGLDPTPKDHASGDAKWPPYSDRDAGGSWEELELTKHDNGHFDVRFVAANRQLSIGPEGLESRSAGAVGAWELPFATEQPDGLKILYRTEDGKLTGPMLTIEER